MPKPNATDYNKYMTTGIMAIALAIIIALLTTNTQNPNWTYLYALTAGLGAGTSFTAYLIQQEQQNKK